MIIISHLLTGATIGGRTKKIWPAFILAVISHYLLDALPHWDYVPNFEAALQPANFLKVVLDFTLAVLILWFTFRFLINPVPFDRISNPDKGIAFLPSVISKRYGIKRKLSKRGQMAILVGAGAALLPDFLEMIHLFFNAKILNALSSFHHFIHCQWVISFWQGLPIFLLFTLGSVFFLVYTFYPNYSLAEKEILAVEEKR